MTVTLVRTSGSSRFSIGRRLRRLETRVGATLFEQTREGQVLTEAGEAMLAEGEAIGSIGFSFDYQDKGNSQDVYTSTGDAAQSVQAFHRTGGQQVYPPAGIKKTTLKVGDVTTIEFTVKGPRLVIVLNGKQYKRRTGIWFTCRVCSCNGSL